MKWNLKSLLPPADLGWNRVRARCASPVCHNKLLTRSVPQGRAGIHVDESWYCSVDCLAAAARGILGALSARRVVEMPRNPRLSLGLALLSRGYLTEDQLRFATERSRRNGEDLEDTLLHLGLAGEKQLAGARAAQWGYPVLAQDLAPQTVTAEFPRRLMQEFRAVPLHFSPARRRLLLGFVHRVDHSLLQSIEQVTGCRAEPCFMTPAEFEEQMPRVDAPPNYEEALMEEPGPPERMARSLGAWAVEVGARKAAFIRCKSYIWVRLSGKVRIADILFPVKGAASPKLGESTALWETARILS